MLSVVNSTPIIPDVPVKNPFGCVTQKIAKQVDTAIPQPFSNGIKDGLIGGEIFYVPGGSPADEALYQIGKILGGAAKEVVPEDVILNDLPRLMEMAGMTP
ncbi:hypothetical protein BGZ76_007415 [Entomortierella beljakovae]|nr:hypothetical protein BGZ76_007415 [Entomortierella beljakovae]